MIFMIAKYCWSIDSHFY